MAKKIIENCMKEMLQLPLRAADGSLYTKYIPKGASFIVDESELLPDTHTKAAAKRLKIKDLS